MKNAINYFVNRASSTAIFTILFSISSTSYGASVTLVSDGNFTGWSQGLVSGSGYYNVIGTGGYPDAFIRLSVPNSLDGIGVKSPIVYTPSTGAIDSISFSADVMGYSESATPNSTYTIFSFAIFQGGTAYFSDAFDFTNPTFANVSAVNLLATDFQETFGSKTPDFSASGAPMQFGIVAGAGFSSLGTYDVDNFLVQANVVPIPAAAWLFGSGLLGLVGVARRKKAA